MTVADLKKEISDAFKTYAAAPHRTKFTPIPKTLTDGKLYEAYILGLLAENLTTQEGLTLRLVASSKIRLRSSPGPIDRRFPHIDVFRNSNRIAELWTDIEFLTLSYERRGSPAIKTSGDFHELDILMLEPGLTGNPQHNSIWLGVECKNTMYEKSLLKQVLGVRREMCLLDEFNRTKFQFWPRTTVPASPPSCLLVYSTDTNVSNYSSPGNTFGIDFFCESI